MMRTAVVAVVMTASLAACDSGFTTPMVGTGSAGSSGDGGAAKAATLSKPATLALGTSGAYYVVDTDACVVRRVDADGVISTVAGNGTCGSSGDGGPATAAQIKPSPVAGGAGLAVSVTGEVYLTDWGNKSIRRVAPDGTITTLASGLDASSLVLGTTGSLYASRGDAGVAKVAADGSWVTVSSTSVRALSADPSGGLLAVTAAGALVHVDELPWTETTVATVPAGAIGLSADRFGNAYLAYRFVPDYYGGHDHGTTGVIRVDTSGVQTLIAGNGLADPGSAAAWGSARALPIAPNGIAATWNNGLLVSSGHVVYRIADPATAPGQVPGVCDSTRFFSGATLSGADLRGADLRNCDLTSADLSGANLRGANLYQADLRGADLSGADLSGADLDSAKVDGANVASAVFSHTRTYTNGTPDGLPPGWVAQSGFLIGPGADLSFTGANAVMSADFSGVDFTGVDLSGVIWGLMNADSIDLSGADLSGAIITTPPLFLDADLTDANLSGLDLSGTNFWGLWSMPAAKFIRTNITGTNLAGAGFSGSYATVTSEDLVGIPVGLPQGWSILNGAFVQT